MKIRIFSGLSLSKDQALEIIPTAEFYQPVRKGDIEQSIRDQVHCCILIDGVFLRGPSVTPGEIHDALNVGMRVYGCSSMGAMRAAELEDYGMIGVGKIFEEIKSKPYFRDDYLGQTFSESGLDTFSIPFIDLRLSCEMLLDMGRLSKDQYDIITFEFESLHFSNRCIPELFQVLKRKHGKDAKVVQVVQKLPELFKSTKEADALMTLEQVKEDLEVINAWNVQKLSSLSLNT